MINFRIVFLSAFFLIFGAYNASSQSYHSSCPILTESQINDFVLDVESNKIDLSKIDDCLKKNYKLFFSLVKYNPSYFQYADKAIKSDETFIKNFVRNSPEILEYIPEKLKRDPVFFKNMAKIYDKSLEYAGYELINNRSFMKEMIDLKPENFSYASLRLQDDFDMVMYAVKKNGDLIKYASTRMVNDPRIAKEAVNSNVISAGYVPYKMQNQKDIKGVVNKFNYSFLFDIDGFLKENYGGIDVGPKGLRGYRIVNQAKLLNKKPIFDREDFIEWKRFWKGSKKSEIGILTNKMRNLNWKVDLEKYPGLAQEIDKFLEEKLDKSASNYMVLTSLWSIKEDPDILVFKLYLLRPNSNPYDGKNINNTSYIVGIAYNKEDPKPAEDKKSKTISNEKKSDKTNNLTDKNKVEISSKDDEKKADLPKDKTNLEASKDKAKNEDDKKTNDNDKSKDQPKKEDKSVNDDKSKNEVKSDSKDSNKNLFEDAVNKDKTSDSKEEKKLSEDKKDPKNTADKEKATKDVKASDSSEIKVKDSDKSKDDKNLDKKNDKNLDKIEDKNQSDKDKNSEKKDLDLAKDDKTQENSQKEATKDVKLKENIKDDEAKKDDSTILQQIKDSAAVLSKEKSKGEASKIISEKKSKKPSGKWILTIIDSAFNVDLSNNIVLKNNHNEYDFWDVYDNGKDKFSVLIFRVKAENSEYFEIFSKQNNDSYQLIFRGGGYNFDF